MKSKTKSGFSLIEVMFGIVLTGMIATLLAVTMPTASQSRTKANYQNRALTLARKEMEAIRSLGYANITPDQLRSVGAIDSTTAVATNTYSFTNVDNTQFDNASLVLPSGTGRIKIDQAALDLKTVTVTVSWNDRGSTRSVTLVTNLANL